MELLATVSLWITNINILKLFMELLLFMDAWQLQLPTKSKIVEKMFLKENVYSQLFISNKF